MDLPIKQLHALFQLHSNIAADKSLFNMQLPAMHIVFMLDHNPDIISIPDLPGTLEAFKDITTPSVILD
ncbi:hypothetical protein BYT27DRAFT_7250018 [Phlegmacium glaucopus]|nr:hypothetical protein BYT27DRAFT_7250018 [Phlegmacium glaucopus]